MINSGDGKAAARILELIQQRGVDVAIEAVGVRATFDICQAIVAPGGHLANIGVHGKSVSRSRRSITPADVQRRHSLPVLRRVPRRRLRQGGRSSGRSAIIRASQLAPFLRCASS